MKERFEAIIQVVPKLKAGEIAFVSIEGMSEDTLAAMAAYAQRKWRSDKHRTDGLLFFLRNKVKVTLVDTEGKNEGQQAGQD